MKSSYIILVFLIIVLIFALSGYVQVNAGAVSEGFERLYNSIPVRTIYRRWDDGSAFVDERRKGVTQLHVV